MYKCLHKPSTVTFPFSSTLVSITITAGLTSKTICQKSVIVSGVGPAGTQVKQCTNLEQINKRAYNHVCIWSKISDFSIVFCYWHTHLVLQCRHLHVHPLWKDKQELCVKYDTAKIHIPLTLHRINKPSPIRCLYTIIYLQPAAYIDVWGIDVVTSPSIWNWQDHPRVVNWMKVV